MPDRHGDHYKVLPKPPGRKSFGALFICKEEAALNTIAYQEAYLSSNAAIVVCSSAPSVKPNGMLHRLANINLIPHTILTSFSNLVAELYRR